MPEVDDERAEIINYGLHLIIGELPKTFIILGLSYFLGVFKLTLLTVILLLPYRAVSGGFHLKTHIGCIVGTTLIYSGVAKISNYIIFSNQILKCIIAAIFVACIIPNNEISNVLVFGYLVQSITITRFAYKLTKNKYGYEVYKDDCISNI